MNNSSSFATLNELHYRPINYKSLGQMNKLKKQYEVLNKIKNERLVLKKLKSNSKMYKEIDCIINEDYNVNCLKSISNQNVYLPFDFIKSYFDVYGKLDKNKYDSKERELFHFQHSYSKIYLANDKYDYRKKFLWFENYSVENRARVKYISGLFNVPVSIQWNSRGHFYPIQIAQFGLSHFNKYLSLGQPKFIYIDVDKFMNNDLNDLKSNKNNNDLKMNENDFFRNDQIDLKNDLKEDSKIDGQLNIEQLTNFRNDLINNDLVNDFNQTLDEEPTLFNRLRKRRIIKFNESDKKQLNLKSNEFKTNQEDENNEQSKTDEPNFAKEDESTKNRTIYLNNTSSVILTLNLTKKSAFYNSLFLTFKFKLIKNLRITIVLMNDKRTKFKINYRTMNNEMFRNDNLIYGIGNLTGCWRMFTRNVGVDLIKSLNQSKKKNSNNLKLKNLHLFKIIFNGQAILNEIKLSSNGHFYQFANSVNWLLTHQDDNGGLASKVNKRLISSSLILNTNWYSSMAQAHSISLLLRMFHFRNEFDLKGDNELKINFDLKNRSITNLTIPDKIVNDELERKRLKNDLNEQFNGTKGDDKINDYFIDNDNLILNNSLIYLNAALDAIELFKKNITQNGISAYFMNRYRFYEEFPTQPSLFVLNGFIYSLFGLYDLRMTIDLLVRNQKLEQSVNDYYLNKLIEVDQLFNDGVYSLKNLLPLYDTGSSSLYDLRHFTLKNQAPNIARWDYHSVHVNLLSHFNTILNDQNIDDCIQRWIGYMNGKKASHN